MSLTTELLTAQALNMTGEDKEHVFLCDESLHFPESGVVTLSALIRRERLLSSSHSRTQRVRRHVHELKFNEDDMNRDKHEEDRNKRQHWERKGKGEIKR